jgi:ribosomal protein S18 acetylase RimI-like enzyme
MPKTSDYRVITALPSPEQYLDLRKRGGLSAFSLAGAQKAMQASYFCVLLQHAGETIGMGRIVGDGGCFFQIVDIVVAPEHQRRGLGRMIMTALMDHLRANAPPRAYVSLIADIPANKLYEQFGFAETAPRSVAMAVRLA